MSFCVKLLAYLYIIHTCQSQLITAPTIIPDTRIANLQLDIELTQVGQLFVSVYDKSRKQYFPRGSDNNVFKAVGPIIIENEDSNAKTTIQVTIKGLIIGNVYAISLFHDINSNNKFDVNLIGIPKDGYGASYQNENSDWFQTPRWKECHFTLTTDMASKPYKLDMKYAP